MIRAY